MSHGQIDDFKSRFAFYKKLGSDAMAQMTDGSLNVVPTDDGNSVAMIVRHVSGNLTSRFTDFLTTDGEKPDRNRDDEFVTRSFSRGDVESLWSKGWRVLEDALAGLDDAKLSATVAIRNEKMSVHAALCRSLAHVAYHVGQIVLLARMSVGADWKSLSIPKHKP